MQQTNLYAWRNIKFDIWDTIILTYPIIIAQLGLILMGTADTMMVGRVGANELASSGIVNSLFFWIACIGIGVNAVISPLVANAHSQQNTEDCKKILVSALRVNFWISVGTILVMSVINLCFHLLQQPKEIEIMSISYFWILIANVLPFYFFLGLKSFADGLSLTKIGMFVTFGGLLFNVFLNWILIFGKLGFPALGLDGAGYATTITRWGMFLAIFLYIFSKKNLKIYTKKLSLTAYYPEFYAKIWKLGIPSGSQFFFEVGAFSFCAMIVGWLGKYPLAAHQVAINLASITYMVVTGIASAGSIKVGNALGEKDLDKARVFGVIALLLGFLFMLGACLFFVFQGEWLISFYTLDQNVLIIAINLMLIAGIFQLADGIQAVSLGILRGLEDANIPTAITMFAYWVVGVPSGYLFGIKLGLGTNGVWYGLSLGLLVSALLLTIRFFRVIQKKKLSLLALK